ncbi:MAG TPA: ABC transporter permease [Opitutaceae bacterium]|nr:ABC transporter permease [Opitutaceae bacterium]
MRSLLARIRDLFRRPKVARDFDEEMAFHLAELERVQLERGASPEEARQAAALEFGNTLRARENVREQAGFASWDELAGDVKLAWRGILRRPAMAGSIVVILALGLGAAATIHGLIDSVFLRPLPVPDPEQIHAITSSNRNDSPRLSRGTVRRLEEFFPANSVAAFNGGLRCTVQIGSGEASRNNTRMVNGSFFTTLGVSAAAGRLLAPSDDVPGSPTDVAVVGHRWAVERFGTAAAAVGREISVNRIPIEIVGVIEPRFREISIGTKTDIWFATALQPRLRAYGNASIFAGDDRGNNADWNLEERVSWMQVLLRKRVGSPPLQATVQRAWEVQRDDMAVALEDPREKEAFMHRSWPVVPAPAGMSHFREEFKPTGMLLGGVVAVLLILVCSNVSGLLLVRSMSRHREIGVRLALGAGSLRVVRLGFLEAVILSGLGALAGFVLALWLLPATVKLLAPGQDIAFGLGLRAVGFMGALALLTAVLSTLGPGLWIARVEPLRALSGNRGLGRAPVRLGRALVVAQFAIAVTLVAVATALGTELQRSLSADPGFEREQVMTALFDAKSAGYKDEDAPAVIERLQSAAGEIPGVSSSAFSVSGLLAGSQTNSGLSFRDPRVNVPRSNYQHDSVSLEYFDTVGMHFLIGRKFLPTDSATTGKVAIVNATFAREIFRDIDPIGQRFGYDATPSDGDFTVIGVVADARMNGVRERPPALFYTPAAQSGMENLSFLAVRFNGAGEPILANLRAAFAKVEPGIVFTSWKTLEARMVEDLSGDLATTKLAAIFGGCAILLAGAGIAGALGYLVVLRQRELALRMAIGAAPGDVQRGVLLDALRLGAIGGGIGLVVIWVVPLFPVVEAALHGRPGLLPAFLAAIVALVTATIAGWIPARRASRIDPLVMLKAE